jgi:hypothetical protein
VRLSGKFKTAFPDGLTEKDKPVADTPALRVSADNSVIIVAGLTVPLPFTDLVAEHVYGNAIELFGIVPRHLDVLTTLPFYHKDPFDRLIIAQGKAEDIPILSRDPAFDDYEIRRLWT